MIINYNNNKKYIDHVFCTFKNKDLIYFFTRKNSLYIVKETRHTTALLISKFLDLDLDVKL